MTRRWALVAVAAPAACAHAPRTPPPELAAVGDPRCPLPLVWPSPEQTPRRVRLRNATADTLVVVIDRCFHYTTLAALAPGQTANPILPPKLIAYPGGIRFHAYIASQSRFVGSWHVLATPGPSLDLILDSTTRARGELALYDLMGDTVSLRPELHEDDEGKSYLMLPEVADGGFLIWSCAAGRRWLSLSTALKIATDSVEIATRVDGGAWSDDRRWEVLHSLTDAALVPEREIDSLTVRSARAKLVNVRVVTRRYPPNNGRTTPPSTTTFGFRTDQLRGGLAGVACFRALAAKLTDR